MLFTKQGSSFALLFWQNKKAEDGGEDEEEVLDEETKKRDQIVKGAIDGLIREHAADLNAPSQDDDSHRRKRKKEKKEEVCQPLVAVLRYLPQFTLELQMSKMSVVFNRIDLKCC